MLNLAELLRTPCVDTSLPFDISPDHKRIAFSWNKSGTWKLWEQELSASDSPRLVSEIQGAQSSPKYSPDGKKLAFALDVDGSESYHIVIQDLINNITRDLTPHIAYAHRPNLSWSPDGQTLAVLSDAKGQFALFLLPINGEPAMLLRNVFQPCWDVVWSPDGQWLAVESQSTASDRSIYVVPVGRTRKGPKVTTTQLRIDNIALNARHPAWSSDSKFLAFSAELGEWHDIGLFNIETQAITWVNQSVGDDTQPAWSQDGSRIGWIHSEGAVTSFQVCSEPLCNTKEGSTDIKQIQIGAGVHHFPKFTSDGVVIVYEDTQHPSDLWKINLGNQSAQQLTNSLPEEFHDAGFVQPQEIWYKGKDAAQVPALLYRAKDSNCAVVDINNGHDRQNQCSWNPSINHMVSRGWTVLAPNYRGSTGYGKEWKNASRYAMGGTDADDCAAGVKYLIENNLSVKNKVGITGRSYGGYLAMCCLTAHPELWAVVSATTPFLNWAKLHHDSREDHQYWIIENMGYPEDDQELWAARSPYFFLDKINVPVQIICGENDSRHPASGSIQAKDKMVELGREVELLSYPDEGHSFLNTNNVIDAETKCAEFLAKALET